MPRRFGAIQQDIIMNRILELEERKVLINDEIDKLEEERQDLIDEEAEINRENEYEDEMDRNTRNRLIVINNEIHNLDNIIETWRTELTNVNREIARLRRR